MSGGARRFLISTSSWASGHSVPVYFAALAGELARRGHRVVVAVTGGERELVADGFEVVFWPDGRGASWRDARFAASLLRRERPEVCLANFSAVNLLLVLGRLFRVPLRVAYYHTLLEQVRADGGGRTILERLRIARKAMIYRLANRLIAVSERAAEDLREIYRVAPETIACFHNAAPDPCAGPTGIELLETARRDQSLVAAIRLDASKGPDLLVEAVARLVDRGEWPEGWRVDVFGDGPLRSNLAARIESGGLGAIVRLLGRRSPPEVAAALSRASFSILPSRSDNCPLVAIESLAVGTPVLGARAGGIPELVDETCGHLVAANDIDALRQGMHRMLHDAEREARSRRARERFVERFELGRAVARQADWLEASIGAWEAS